MNKKKEIVFFTGLLPTLNAKEALFMSFMINEFLHANQEWLLFTADQVSLNTGLSRTQQLAIKKRLYDLEILQTERRGLPPKNWYRININKVKQYIPEVL
jgi:hypothetical protein